MKRPTVTQISVGLSEKEILSCMCSHSPVKIYSYAIIYQMTYIVAMITDLTGEIALLLGKSPVETLKNS